MKKLLIAGAFLPMMAMAQTQTGNFTLTGHIGKFNAPAKIYFDYMESGGAGSSDSAVLVNGNFKFSGKLSGIATVRMAFAPMGDGKDKAIFGGGQAIYFYIGKENIKLNSKDSLTNAVFTGSPVYNDYIAFNAAIGGSIMAITKMANDDFNSGTEAQRKDTTWFKAVDARFRQRVRDRNAKELVFAKEHPTDYFSLIALSELTSKAADVAATEPVFDALDMNLRNLPEGKELEQRMIALTSIVPGSMAPDFAENDTTDKPVRLSNLRGKYVLVDFWASWCHPCRAENPNVKKQYALYKDKGLQILSVSLDDKKSLWEEAIVKDDLPWLHVSDLKGWNNEAGKLYGVRAVPSNFLIDPQGKIIAKGLMGDDLDKKLSEIFTN